MDPILVTGLPRSGTTLVTRMLEACGAWVGEGGELAENRAIKEVGIYRPLSELGYDPHGVDPLPSVPLLYPPAKLRRDVLRARDESGYEGGPWLFKDPKLLLLWPAWAEAFPRSHWFVVNRPPAAVLASLVERFRIASPERMASHYLACKHALDDKQFMSPWAGPSVVNIFIEPVRDVARELEVWFMSYGSLVEPLKWNPDAEKIIDRSKWHYQPDGTRTTEV